jgi:hypothetical protein
MRNTRCQVSPALAFTVKLLSYGQPSRGVATKEGEESDLSSEDEDEMSNR